MARATTSLPVPLSPSSRTGAREWPSFSMRRRTSQICRERPTSPVALCAFIHPIGNVGSNRIYTYYKCRQDGTILAADAISQRRSAVRGGFLAHDHVPETGCVRSLHQPRPAVFSRHLAAQALGVIPVPEGADLYTEKGGG